MQIVIDIPEEMHKAIEHGSFWIKYNIYDIVECVMNGTPLPKGHGRLIDGDELKTAFPRSENSTDVKIASVRATINHMPVIVEADK